jgi:hypothetical protein
LDFILFWAIKNEKDYVKPHHSIGYPNKDYISTMELKIRPSLSSLTKQTQQLCNIPSNILA